ncbi:MAG: CtsR family transcriptional regulator, partial [Christensenellales bacterium]
MNNVSDIIEEFILSTIGDEQSLNLSRNELANFFNVSPSQINYVLSTRFTLDRGYQTESKRGGGGYIVLKRIN